jgi:adenosylcobinamide-phosphate synthase
LLARVGHPVIWIGALVDWLDARLNRPVWSFFARRFCGVAALAALLLAMLLTGAAIQRVALALPFGPLLLALLASSLLAQRSLHDHVEAVAQGLDVSLEEGRRAVSQIVGRDVSELDSAAVARAAIESLAENFSDGVVAPALWMAFAGLPGALAYKALNTADSMVGHRTPRHAAFGWASARLDDAANLPASRLSAALLALAAIGLPGASMGGARKIAMRDAKKHLSPNAGWPEAAMAGALGLSLGGPRSYGTLAVPGAYLGDGRRSATSTDIRRALKLYRRAAAIFWFTIALAFFGINRL